MPLWTDPALALLIGYLLGSIPFGVVLTRLFGAGDVRQIGSGNIGATNVLRTGRKGLAAGTLLLDMAKGAAAVCITRELGTGFALLGGVGAFAGHLWPVWIGFKGGKGVATMLGIAFALDWRIGTVMALVWLGSLAITRISSVSGMAAAVAAPIMAIMMGKGAEAVALIALALILIWRHGENLSRLFAGTEPKVGQKAG
ncbi:MAG TPA: glycerol-3-phosphate 1-O-acyltransferase PlsY [Chakrabartia sp.]|jgi:glycerol-3-phosphate acyltransferase PlsY|nr:glycerol-3-phosphate 1-O-acyltransferase PlsY [Chakrabartia sp.]